MERQYLSRPAVWIGFSVFGALLASTFLPRSILPWLCLAAGLLTVVLILCKVHRKSPAAVAVLLSAAVGFGVYSVLSWVTVVPAEQYAENEYTIEAQLQSDAEMSYGNYYYTARVQQILETEQTVDFKIRLSHGEALPAQIDDTVHCTVRFYNFEDQFGLSSRTAQLAGGKVLGAYISDYESVSVTPAAEHTLRYHLAAWRTHLRDLLLEVLPAEEASVLSAMLLGLRDGVSDSLNTAYRMAGASHVLVISGMHMSIISNFALSALLFLGLRRRWAAGVSVLFVLLFMCVSGFSASVVRSGVMQILLLLGILIGRSTDTLNSVAIALLVLMLQNPFCVGDVSLLLSFSSTLGIIVFSSRLLHLLTDRIASPSRRNMAAKLLLPVVSAIGAVLGSLPVQLFVFGTVHLSFIFSSLLVLYISAWIVRLGVVALIFLPAPVLSGAARPFTFCAGLLARLQNFLIRWIADIFPVRLELSGSYLPGTVLVILVFLLFAFWLYRAKRLPVLAYVLAAVLLVSGSVVQTARTNRYTRLLVLDTGYAQCTALAYGKRAVILDCDGSGDKVASMLQDCGVREIGLLHIGTEETEIRCAEALLLQLPTEKVLREDSIYYAEACPDTVYDYGCRVEIDDGTVVSVSANGDRMEVLCCGLTILMEENGAAGLPATADILITDSAATSHSAGLTILRTEDPLAAHLDGLLSGSYLLTSEYPVLSLAIRPEGTYTIHQG